MPRRRNAKDYLMVLQRLKQQGMLPANSPNRQGVEWESLPDIDSRIQSILGLANKPRKSTDMLFFVMYDIESNKVRRQVVKYLERKGCMRVQKSIFLASLSAEKYNDIRTDLTEVQAAYDNNDSILVVPISTDYLKAMKVIGQNIDIDIITKSRTTLFF
jgi:CRISPR-associated endonuclease Cas2